MNITAAFPLGLTRAQALAMMAYEPHSVDWWYAYYRHATPQPVAPTSDCGEVR